MSKLVDFSSKNVKCQLLTSHLDTDSRCLIVTKMSYKVIIINNKSNQLSIVRALTGTWQLKEKERSAPLLKGSTGGLIG